MKMLNNVRELEKHYSNNMIGDILNKFEYDVAWKDMSPQIDSYLRMNYGERELLEYYKSVDEVEVKEDFEVLLYCYLKSKEIEYTRFYKATKLDYAPLENYSMIETEKLTDTNDNMYGERKQTSTDVIGEVKTEYEDTTGASKTTTESVYGELVVNDVSENQKAPFESEEYSNVDKSTKNTTTDAHTDTSTANTDARTDSGNSTVNERTDTNTHIAEEYGDTLHRDYERELTRSGNLGVTTSQQMLESELSVIKKLNVIEYIARDVANIISKGVFFAL